MNAAKARKINREAWDRAAARGGRWSRAEPRGAVRVTPLKAVPRGWLRSLRGKEVLCLAGGGGQQGPALAALGARVTVLDNSPGQLAADRAAAAARGLSLRLALGDMADLSRFARGSFDVVVHPLANCFIPDLRPLWQGVHRVLRPGGRLLAGIANPAIYQMDARRERRGALRVARGPVRGPLRPGGRDGPVEFAHSLEAQLGGLLAAGLRLAGFFEDATPERPAFCRRLPACYALLALKP